MHAGERLSPNDLEGGIALERFRHFAEVVRGTQDAVLSKDLNATITSWNPAAERLYGYTAEEAVGSHVSFLVPPDHKNEEMEILARIINGERIETYETERIRKDGLRVDVSLTVSPIEHPEHGIVGASVIARDITAEQRRRRAQDFLVAATRGLDASLDPYETARTIVGTAVPELSELCVIDFVRADGRLGDSVVAGADPESAARLEQIRRKAPLDPDGEHPVAQTLRAHEPMIWRDLRSEKSISLVAQSEDHRDLIAGAGYSSAAVIELVARGRVLGAISFLHVRQDLRFDESDLELLCELADRAALALDNARLYKERARIAEHLQKNLRPPEPAYVPGLDVSVVFEAAGEGIEVGGDLYDVLPSADGCWIVVGDVAGKGIETAGVSVALRHSVRGLTREVDDPCEVLSRVNELLLEGTTLKDFATAVLIRLRGDGEDWELDLASAGHPPAVRLGEQGAELLGGGTLLGAVDDPPLGRHRCRLAGTETLIVCTDGWMEAGPRENHRTPEDLSRLASSNRELPLSQLTELLRADAVRRGGGSVRDDMVVLAIRPT